MTHLGIVVFVALAITAVPAPNTHHNNHPPNAQGIYCHSCEGVKDPHVCTHMVQCRHDEICYSDVFEVNGEEVYDKGCWKSNDCPLTVFSLIGKRDQSARGRRGHRLMCEKCCATSGCNLNDYCDKYQLNPTTLAPTTKPPPSTAAPTTTVPPQTTVPATTCRDHEEDGFICSTLDAYNFCSETNSSSLSYVLAHTKCQKHCGFCSVSGSSLSATTPLPVVVNTQSPTTPGVPCADHEDQYFDCLSWSQSGNCQQTSGTLHDISVLRCSKFCGFC